jgi:hypothetical protein
MNIGLARAASARARRAQARRDHRRAIDAVAAYVHLRHGHATIFHQDSKVRGTVGTPDMFVMLPQRAKPLTFFVEIKTGEAKPTRSQEDWAAVARVCGLEVIVGGLEEVSARIHAADREAQMEGRKG